MTKQTSERRARDRRRHGFGITTDCDGQRYFWDDYDEDHRKPSWVASRRSGQDRRTA